jgi:hypothetical protein
MLFKVEVTSTETYIVRAENDRKAVELACLDRGCLLTAVYHLAEAYELVEPLIGASSQAELNAPLP